MSWTSRLPIDPSASQSTSSPSSSNMFISTMILALIGLLSASAFAVPADIERRATPVYHAGSLVTPAAAGAAATGDSDFAGAFQQPASSQTYTSVTATFNMVQPTVPAGDSATKNYYFSLWAGM